MRFRRITGVITSAAILLAAAFPQSFYAYAASADNKGDVNLDGNISIDDATDILKIYANQAAGIESGYSSEQTEYADCNSDGRVSIEDATLVLSYYANKAAGLTDRSFLEFIGHQDSDITLSHSFSVHFIDVGQADSALVECDGEYMLIDGGNRADSNVIYSVLKRDNITNLAIVVGTHAHEDHIGGIPGGLEYASADTVLCPVTEHSTQTFENFRTYSEKKSSGITVPSVGETYALGSAEIKILGVNSSSDENNSSIVLMVTYGETRFLFTGDAEREAEQVILDSGADLSCDVLKVGHHGSETSTGYAWLSAAMPQYAVISVGTGNSYGHPTDAVLSRLRDAEVKTFRTDLCGDVYAVSDGKTVTMSCDRTVSDDDIFKGGQSSSSQGTTTTTVSYPSYTTTTTTATTEAYLPTGTGYILNTNSKKFHYQTCSSASKISAANRSEYSGTRESLISMGYSPCGICHP